MPVFKRRPTRTDLENPSGPSISGTLHSPEDRLAEATGLAQAIDLDVIQSLLIPIAAPRPATLIGSGKVDELAAT